MMSMLSRYFGQSFGLGFEIVIEEIENGKFTFRLSVEFTVESAVCIL